MGPGSLGACYSGVAVAELEPLVQDVAFLPKRVRHDDTTAARELLESEGAVIMTGQ
jgi:hypothetical protein